MAVYQYIGRGAFLQGLPARDLDEAGLDDAGRSLLALGVAMALYVKVGALSTPQAVFDAYPGPGEPDLQKPGAGAGADDDLKKGRP